MRYEAGESVWRLTGMDFEFDAYAPLEEQAGSIERIRAEWELSGRKGAVRDRHGLNDYIADLGRAP